MGFFDFLKSKMENKDNSKTKSTEKFKGFKLSNARLQNILDNLDYSDKKVDELIDEYSDVIPSLIMGMVSPVSVSRVNEFAEHMAMASSKGNYKAVALSCFAQQGDLLNQYLPVPIDKMSDQSLEYLLIQLNNYRKMGFSKSLKKYLKNNRIETETLANQNNKYAQFLMGFWYAFDNYEIDGEQKCLVQRMYWYERSALNGFLPAMIQTANLNDDAIDNLPTDLKKAAYWYRKAALQGEAHCAYNLAVMYLQGDGVKCSKSQATLWLSYAFKYADNNFKVQIKQYSNKNNINLDSNPNMKNDIEFNNSTAELNIL